MNYVGYVYKCVNVFNEKVYIGITIESLEERKRKHISDTLRNKDKCHFHRALRKYGLDAFEWSVIETISSNSKENLLFCLKNLEIKYVKLYDSYNSGYNSTPGGDNSRTVIKSVDIYTEDGILLGTFDSRTDAAEYLEISKSAIIKCCSGKQKFSKLKDGTKIICKNHGEIPTSEEFEFVKSFSYSQCSEVFAYTESSKLIQKFDSIKEAALYFNIDRQHISDCLRGKRKFAGIYNGNKVIWKKQK